MAKAVNVMDLVDARSTEITAAIKAITTNHCISHALSIPVHLRRRAASHNPKRLPARCRHSAVEKKPKKKWKAKSAKKDVEGKAVRLETHLWHAKRCHMVDLWGYRLATSTTQRADRASYRALHTSCTIQDTSFYQWSSLSGSDLQEQLNNHIRPNAKVVLHRVISSYLYHNDRCLGPVLVFWLSGTHTIIRVHPGILCHTKLEKIFVGLDITSHKDKLSQFTLDGVKSLELITKSLNLDDESPDYVRNIWSRLAKNPFSYDIMKGTVLGAHLVTPPVQFKCFKNIVNHEISQPEERLIPDRKLRGELLFESLSYEPMDVADGTPPKLPCCIIKDPTSNSFHVIIPSGTRTKVWIQLVYNGGRVIGVNDARYLMTERDIPSFPHDYPDTLAGQEYSSKVGNELEEKENRRPPQKRIKYSELGITSPYIPDWKSVCKFDEIHVLRDPVLLHQINSHLGIPPEYNNYLVAVALTSLKCGVVTAGSRLYYTTRYNNIDPEYTDSDTYPLVGYITSGRYSLSHGKGAGIGLIAVTAFQTLSNERVLLVRRTTTRTYRFVKVQLLY